MRRAAPLLLLLLPACVSPAFRPTTPLLPEAEGLPALQFTRTVRLDGPLGNRLELPAGAVFVADRRRDEDGAQLWCGTMHIVDLAVEARPMCMVREGNAVQLIADVRNGGWPRTLPDGSFREFRLR